MSIESRLKRGDNPEDVRALFPQSHEEVDRVLKDMKKKPAKKKAVKKSKS